MAKSEENIKDSGISFDPLKYMKRLEAVGFTREQAEAQAETFLTVVQEQQVTKQDLKEFEVQLSSQMKEIDVRLSGQMKENESKATLEIEVLKRDLKLWFGGMLVGLVVVMSGIMTLITHL